MTTDQQIKELNKIEELAAEGRVPEAISSLRAYLQEIKDNERLRWLETTESDYRRMLDYYLTGNPDPYRHPMHSKTAVSLLSAASDCRRDIRIRESSDLFATKARFENLQNHSLTQRLAGVREASLLLDQALAEEGADADALRKERDTRLSLFFYKLWTLRTLSEQDEAELRRILMAKDEDFLLQAQIINALLLRCMDYFDHNVVLLLADVAEGSASDKIVARSLVALILLMTRHRKKLENNDMIRMRFELWEENLLIYVRLREVILALIRTRDTDRISDTMKSEVIPELMKMRPEIMKKMRDITPDTDPSMLEENPEWEEMMKRSGLSDKLRELSELQSEGADVLMVAFSNLKSFPFFNDLGNWLLPFDINHSDLGALRSLNHQGIENLLVSPVMVMCDSDKYSLAFSMTAMPSAQRDAMFGQFEAQLEQLATEQDERLLKTSTPEFDRETNMYVRDLYRFYKLNPRRKEFADPFEKVSEFTRLPVIGDILMDSDIIDIAAEFFFRHRYYREALEVFQAIDRHHEGEAEGSRYEKMGFCYQKLGDHTTALSYYDKAALIAPESKWLLKKRAFCSRHAGHFKQAAELYRQILQNDPENLNMICMLADCLAAEGKPEEALKEYYKADYLQSGNQKVERAIVWNELRSGHYDKSRRYSVRVLAGTPTARDFINAGHLDFLEGKPGDAARNYKEAIKAFGSREVFDTAIAADIETLIEHGADSTDFQLLLNAISY